MPFQRDRILVTGASGHIGREVVAQLRAADLPVRALSRNPHAGRLPDGVEMARGDLTSPDTLDRALGDVAAVFLVSVAPLAPAADAIARIASPAHRIVFLSAPIHTPHPFFQQPNPIRSVHAGVEQLIETSGARWTFVRPAPFAINCRNWWAPQIGNGDTVRWFHGSAETALVHERDIAAVAVSALCDGAREHSRGRRCSLRRTQTGTSTERAGRKALTSSAPLEYPEISSKRHFPLRSSGEKTRHVWRRGAVSAQESCRLDDCGAERAATQRGLQVMRRYAFVAQPSQRCFITSRVVDKPGSRSSSGPW